MHKIKMNILRQAQQDYYTGFPIKLGMTLRGIFRPRFSGQYDRLAEPLKAFSTHWRGSSLLGMSISTILLVILFSGNLLAQRNQLTDLVRQIPKPTINKELSNPSAIKIARLHYSGGGDWYWGRSAIPNMLKFVSENTDFLIDTLEHEITINDPDLFKYPFLFATGHGLISFEADEIERLRLYLSSGGFLFVNDSYGMEKTFLKEMAKIFPEREIVELPFDHPLYHSFYDFPNGPPKIHEHDNKSPRGYAVIVNGKAVVYFLVESDIGDGWEDAVVHNDPEDKRTESFQMGLNLISYALLY